MRQQPFVPNSPAMEGRRYAEWVAPTAKTLAADRRAVIEFARALPDAAWDEPAGDGDWRKRDVLAHLAGGNDRMVQTVLSAVLSGEAVDAALLDPDTDEANARGIEERRAWPIARLIDELERDGEEMQELLGRLTDAHREVRPGGAAWTVEGLLRLVHHERHDFHHLGQLRA